MFRQLNHGFKWYSGFTKFVICISPLAHMQYTGNVGLCIFMVLSQ
nr:MAG TPA: hypothetical protein [Caudoviricetes sp.]